jgi:WD40 repeat protein
MTQTRKRTLPEATTWRLAGALALLALASRPAPAQGAPDFTWSRGGHGHVVARSESSPDGTLWATSSGDASAKLWRASDGQLLHTLEVNTGSFSESIQGLAFSADGQLLATAGWDNAVRLWNVADGVLVRTITDPATYFNAVEFSPDGQYVCAAGGSAGTLKLWSVATGALVRTFNGHADWVNDLAFSPDGLRLASVSSDDTLRTWVVATGAQAWSVAAHDTQAVGVDWAPDGLSLASSGGVNQPRVKTWNAASGALIRTYTGQTHQSNDVKFSPDGLRLAAGGGDGQVRIWATATGVLQLSLPISVPPTIVAGIDWTPDGAHILAGDNIRRFTVWDAASGQQASEVTAHPGWVHGLDFSPDGASLASAAFVIPLLCPVKLYDVASGEPAGELGDVPWGMTDLCYSPDGRYLAGSSGSGVTYLVDLTDPSPDWTIPVSGPADFPWFARFSPDGTLLASGGTEGTAQLWSVTSPPQLVDFLDFGVVDARNAAFTPDGSQLVIALGHGVVVWDLATGGETVITFPQQQNVSDIRVAPDGLSFFASHGSGLSGTYWIRQVDLATHADLRLFVGHTDAIHSIDLSSDGQLLLSGGADFTVRLWSVADGTLLRTYDEECGFDTIAGAEGVPRVVFSPDDTLFAYGRNDGTLSVARNPFANPWTGLGGGLAGVAGVPQLSGAGSLQPASTLELGLSDAAPLAVTTLVVGLATINLPFKGGVLVPAPDVVLAGLATDVGGAWQLPAVWPAGVPSGLQFFLQAWIPDAGGPAGFAASNGLQATTP